MERVSTPKLVVFTEEAIASHTSQLAKVMAVEVVLSESDPLGSGKH